MTSDTEDDLSSLDFNVFSQDLKLENRIVSITDRIL